MRLSTMPQRSFAGLIRSALLAVLLIRFARRQSPSRACRCAVPVKSVIISIEDLDAPLFHKDCGRCAPLPTSPVMNFRHKSHSVALRVRKRTFASKINPVPLMGADALLGLLSALLA